MFAGMGAARGASADAGHGVLVVDIYVDRGHRLIPTDRPSTTPGQPPTSDVDRDPLDHTPSLTSGCCSSASHGFDGGSTQVGGAS